MTDKKRLVLAIIHSVALGIIYLITGIIVGDALSNFYLLSTFFVVETLYASFLCGNYVAAGKLKEHIDIVVLLAFISLFYMCFLIAIEVNVFLSILQVFLLEITPAAVGGYSAEKAHQKRKNNN